jgi:hypothetical protein
LESEGILGEPLLDCQEHDVYSNLNVVIFLIIYILITAWNEKVSWANLCWHIRGERSQNLTSSGAVPTLGATGGATSSAELTLAAAPSSAEKLQAKLTEWQESLWFEAELEAEHAAEQQAVAKIAKVEVELVQVVVLKAENALGTTCSGSTSSTFTSTMLKAEVEQSLHSY